MDVRDEFEQGLRKYAKLEVLWTMATVAAIAAYVTVPRSYTLGIALFFVGGLLLSAAGLTCAYTIAKENI